MKQKIIAIYRLQKHSPNLSSADTNIMNKVVDKLKAEGYEIVQIAEDEFLDTEISGDIIINMCRTEAALKKLQHLISRGVLVINSPQAIKNCSRRNLQKLFIENAIPTPATHIIKTTADEETLQQIPLPCWLKLPDTPTIQKEDINYISTLCEFKEALQYYQSRGEGDIVVSQHQSGDLVKFYSVSQSDFLHISYPTLEKHSKFGYESYNDTIKSIPFSKEKLLQISHKAAEAVGIKIYGGDCIINQSGDICIIDFNDWPSFSSCAEEASFAITEMIKKEIEQWNRKK